MKIALVSIASILFCIGCSKSGGSTTPTTTGPTISIADVSQARVTTNSTFQFNVSLSAAATKDATIQYATVDGAAKQGKDYQAATGTVTIAAGSSSATIKVTVNGDSTRQADQDFYVQLSNPQNCSLGTSGKATGIIINQNLLYFPVDNAGYAAATSYPGYTIAWSDEFSGNAVNTNNWTFETGNNSGWGNGELEYYTSSTNNAFVSQGNLIIEARKESAGGFNYSSARMITKGNQSFQYGRIDIRAKLPIGQGLWPALWLLGANIDQVGWPTCGEIDMMELLGHQPNKIYGTLHWGSSVATHESKGGNYTLASGSFDQQFHVYSLQWDKDSLGILIDDQKYFSFPSSNIPLGNPFNNKFFLLFNIAVGGAWPGAPDGTTQFPQRMVVDYVRVYQK